MLVHLSIACHSSCKSASSKPVCSARLALMKPFATYSPYGIRLFRPIVLSLSSGCFSSHAIRSATVLAPLTSSATAIRVIETSSGRIGSTERAKVTCTGPRTCPALSPVLITAPNARHHRTSRTSNHARGRTFFFAAPLSLSAMPPSVLSCACAIGPVQVRRMFDEDGVRHRVTLRKLHVIADSTLSSPHRTPTRACPAGRCAAHWPHPGLHLDSRSGNRTGK